MLYRLPTVRVTVPPKKFTAPPFPVIVELFEKVLSGKKKFDLRLDDMEIEEGDILVLKEIDSERNFTGREIEKQITFVVRTKDLDYWSEEEKNKKGFVVMSLE